MTDESSARALEQLLASWRENRCPELADAIDRVSLTIPPSTPELPSLPKKSVHSAWMKVSGERRAEDVPVLLAALFAGTIDEVGQRLAELQRWPADPRIAMGAAKMVVTVPFQSTSSQKHWSKTFDLVVDGADWRTRALIEQVHTHPVAISGSSMRTWMANAVGHCLRALDKRFVNGAPTPTDAQRALLARLAGTSAPQPISDAPPKPTLDALLGEARTPGEVRAPDGEFALHAGSLAVFDLHATPDGSVVVYGASEMARYGGARAQGVLRVADRAILRQWLKTGATAISPDGLVVATALYGQPITLRSLTHGDVMETYTAKPAFDLHASVEKSPTVHHLAWSPDGRFLAVSISWGYRMSVQLDVIDLLEGTTRSYCAGMKNHAQHEVVPSASAFTADGAALWVMSMNNLARVSLATGEVERQIHQATPQEYFTAFALEPGGSRVVAAKTGGAIGVWRDDGTHVQDLKGHTGHVNRLAFTADGRALLSAAVTEDGAGSYDIRLKVSDPTVRVWNARTLTEALCWTLERVPTTVALVPAGDAVLVADGPTVTRYAVDGHVVDGAPPTATWSYAQGRTEVLALACARRADVMVSLRDRALDAWIVRSGDALGSYEGSGSAVAVSANGDRFAVIGGGRVALRITRGGRVVGELSGHTKPVQCAAFSGDGTRIATGSDDRTAIVWNALDGTQIQVVGEHRGRVGAVAFTADDRVLVTACDDGALRAFSTGTWDELCAIQVRSGVLRALSVSDDGTLAAVASADGISVWSLRDRCKVLDLPHAPMASVALRPDGALLAALGEHGSLQLVRVRDGAVLFAQPDGYSIGGTLVNTSDGWQRVHAGLSFTHDGRALVVGAGREGCAGAMRVLRW